MSESDLVLRDASGLRSIPDLFVEVIDQYYADGNAVREFGLGCTFTAPFTGTWRGLQSVQRYPNTESVFYDLAGRIPVKGETTWTEIETSFKFWGRPSAGMFAVLLEGQEDTVHFHHRSGTWAAVCYLCRQNEIGRAKGLGFYRHRETGAYSCHGATKELLECFRRDAAHHECWEEVGAIDLVFNRMVLFNGRFFHAASPGFGDSPATGRLTQLFNIDFKTS